LTDAAKPENSENVGFPELLEELGGLTHGISSGLVSTKVRPEVAPRPRSGVSKDTEWFHVITLENGKMKHWRGHNDTAMLAEAYHGRSPAKG
jgi:hypothetical protein